LTKRRFEVHEQDEESAKTRKLNGVVVQQESGRRGEETNGGRWANTKIKNKG
jgi:hypothetical protein